jgi:hypothetical protein
MSTRLHSRHSSSSTAGIQQGPTRRPSNRYRVSPRRVLHRLDSVTQHAAVHAARRFGRREFIRRAGDAALVTGLSLSAIVWEVQRANATDPTNNCGPTSGGCDNSYICTQSQICSSDPAGGKNCNVSGCNCGGVRRRVNCSTHRWSNQNSSCCGSSSNANCWRENCPSGCKRCCDCCVPPSFGYSNTCNMPSCGGSDKRKCICRSNVSTC